mmetsp:Transcript_10753/g.18436  ORF Transcript_10753/g.18436 Transcript_10753/m.18436 type:complete len:292 (-) Transcript_10753:100-975(-)
MAPFDVLLRVFAPFVVDTKPNKQCLTPEEEEMHMCDITMRDRIVAKNINTEGLPGYERRHYWLRGELEQSNDEPPPSIELNVRELCSPEQGAGGRVWHCSVILAGWLHRQGASLLRGKRVLELGAGLGAPGLVASLFAAEVILTDYGEVLHNLQYNLDLNMPSIQRTSRADVRVLELDWARWREWQEAPADVVICAEVVYSVESVPALVATLHKCLTPQGVCYLLQDISRSGFLEFKNQLRASGLALAVLLANPTAITLNEKGSKEDENSNGDDDTSDDEYRLFTIQRIAC